MALGIVKFYNETKGFGFVVPDGGGNDLILEAGDIVGSQQPKEGDRVEFRLVDQKKGPQAIDVRILEN